MSSKQRSTRVKITERALFQRINRRLKQDNEQLRTARSTSVEQSVGQYFIVDLNRNAITTQYVDLEKLGRELGVIQPWEELEKMNVAKAKQLPSGLSQELLDLWEAVLLAPHLYRLTNLETRITWALTTRNGRLVPVVEVPCAQPERVLNQGHKARKRVERQRNEQQ